MQSLYYPNSPIPIFSQMWLKVVRRLISPQLNLSRFVFILPRCGSRCVSSINNRPRRYIFMFSLQAMNFPSRPLLEIPSSQCNTTSLRKHSQYLIDELWIVMRNIVEQNADQAVNDNTEIEKADDNERLLPCKIEDNCFPIRLNDLLILQVQCIWRNLEINHLRTPVVVCLILKPFL